MKIIYFFLLVAKALPLLSVNVTLNLKKEIYTIYNIVVLDAGVCIYLGYSVIGSGIARYYGFVYKSYLERLINLNFNFFILGMIWAPVLFLLLAYLFDLYHVFYYDIFNPCLFISFDLNSYFSQDIIISYFFVPLFSHIRRPLNRFNYSKSANTINKFNKDLTKLTGGGYMSYKNVLSLGFLIELIDNYPLLLKKIENFTSNLEDNKTYTLLPVVRWIDDDTGFTQSITISDSFKINKFVNINILAKNFQDAMNSANNKYSVGNFNAEFVLMYRVWLDIKDFNVKNDEISIITKTIENNLSKKRSNIDDLIIKRLTINDNYNNILMNNYGDPIIINGLVTSYKINNNESILLHKGINDTNFIKVKNLNTYDDKHIITTWTDTKKDFGFIRNKNGINYYFNHQGSIFKTEATYNFLDYPDDNIHSELDTNIGTIDFETFGEEGMGLQNVYAGGWAINDFNKTKKFYYIEKDENSLDVVKKIISDLANNLDINGYTFYAHNLGRFDSVFLIKGCILLDDIEIIPKWKENKILSITFKNTKNNCKFKVLDSIQMLNASLDSLCKSFEIINKKGIFPHNFVNKKRLFYIGQTPLHKYFKNMPLNLYEKNKKNNWNLKDECLKYLEKDVLGLLEVMIKFNEKIFNLYSLNITKFVTAPKLAVAIYTTNFYSNTSEDKIKMIRGIVEKDIRSAYFGGNVNVCVNKINKAFYYDMNSQYPFAMLNDMPIGNPTFSNDTDLNNYFGFVYGEITAPDYNRLRVPYIQNRDEKNDVVFCPRGKFTRMIFSEEIKEAIKDGYSMKIKYGYKFERGKDLFKNYVENIYNIKKTTKDPVEKTLSKLLLNSLYGKFGMKDITSNIKIVNKEDSKKITNKYNFSMFAELDNGKVLIKYSSKIPDSLRKLLKDNDSDPKKITDKTLFKKRGVPSAVQISAAISAYARMSINKFKNIPGNPCIMSDTDSVILTKNLPDICIGKELGQMKLEHEIEEGIFIRKKLYALKTITNQEVIKSSGVKPASLNYDKFKLLLSGESVKCDALSFQVLWKDLNINIVNRSINLQGLKSPIIDIKNHYDINFKAIVPYIPSKKEQNIDNKLLSKNTITYKFINKLKIKLIRLLNILYKSIKALLTKISQKYS